jgi:hypothetical protein
MTLDRRKQASCAAGKQAAANYWREEIIPALRPILADVVRQRPENPLQFISDALIAHAHSIKGGELPGLLALPCGLVLFTWPVCL